jgi:hypothetical protein
MGVGGEYSGLFAPQGHRVHKGFFIHSHLSVRRDSAVNIRTVSPQRHRVHRGVFLGVLRASVVRQAHYVLSPSKDAVNNPDSLNDL